MNNSFTKIQVWGHWHDDNVRFTRHVVVANKTLTPDALQAALDDDDVFFIFDYGEKVLGVHEGFTLTEREVC